MCECSNHGFCKRHNRDKTPAEFQFCKTDKGFNFFEKHVKKPNILTQAISATKAVIKHIANNFETVPEDTRLARMNICSSCPLFDKSRRCLSCGCYVDIKIQMASEECPEGKWLAEKAGKKCGSCGS